MIVAAIPTRTAIAAQDATSPWRVSWPLIVGMLLFAILVTISGERLLADPDSHWHIAVGRWIIEHGRVPTVDIFSHTFAGRPWIAKEWLSQILMALAFAAGGWGGVVVLCSGSIALSFALMMRLLLRNVGPLLAGVFTVAAIVMTAPHLLARPHVLAFPFMLIWVAGLVRAVEERRAPAPLLLAAMVLWANLHGGFTFGLLLCGAFALEAVVTAHDTAERKFLLLEWLKFGGAAVLAACITPYGAQSMLVTLHIFGLGDALGMIKEWKSPDFHTHSMQELLLLLAIFAGLLSGLKLPFVRLLVVIGLMHMFLKYARNAELLALLAPLAVAPVLARQWPFLRTDFGAPAGRTCFRHLADLGAAAGRYGVTTAVALAIMLGAVIVRYGDVQPPTDTTPTAALAFARQASLTGPVFNSYGFGGALIQAGVPTFIDGRAELFGGEFIKRYAEAVDLSGQEPLESLLDRYGIEWTLLQKDQPANKLLEQLPGWRLLYRDDVAVIFARRAMTNSRSTAGSE